MDSVWPVVLGLESRVRALSDGVDLFWIECIVVMAVAGLTVLLARGLRLPGPSTIAVGVCAILAIALVLNRGTLSDIGLAPVPPLGQLGLWLVYGTAGLIFATAIGQSLAFAMGRPPNIERFSFVRGNPRAFAGMLALVWTTAAFGEEILFRGFFQAGLIAQFGGGVTAALAAIGTQAILFGMGHMYQGPGGVVTTTFAGLALGGLTYAVGGNLWPAIVLHGLVNTMMLTALVFQPRSAALRG